MKNFGAYLERTEGDARYGARFVRHRHVKFLSIWQEIPDSIAAAECVVQSVMRGVSIIGSIATFRPHSKMCGLDDSVLADKRVEGRGDRPTGQQFHRPNWHTTQRN